jgi:UDP-N-acetylglucosamine 4,6-dehydratase
MIVIFGGTGTLGNALTKEILEKYSSEKVVIVSRCELKQKQMADKFNDKRLQFIVGDVRDHHWKSMISIGEHDLVFNLAAMKHVDIAESNVEYCFDVNTNGTKNTLNWTKEHGAKYLFSSTDKAVLPINTYGASKMMAEKLVLSKGGLVFRWGNVLGSRGSVLGAFKKSLTEENKVKITDINMTRFWVLIEDVAKFMLEKKDHQSGIYIPKMGAATIMELADIVADISGMGSGNYEIEETGIRPGEKIHECLWSAHDQCLRSDDLKIRYSYEDLYKKVEKALSDC